MTNTNRTPRYIRFFVEIEEHFLFEGIVVVADVDGVVVTVEVVDQGLDRGFAEVAKIGSGLPWGL